ncbi:membrane alanyl aminopeptidase-like [Maniola hyperantus]|uniref:membrane alanyl aminopeptidase-like n=1 Tax=Aphantopus hyperantus TaxID=2795564 RepID=UPI001567C7F0|nr:membrane alanyl aminopeptidase-like [Maniola hyperantus]
MNFNLKLVVLSAVFVLVKTEFPLDVEEPLFLSSAADEKYRIPEDLDPIQFDIEITPYFEAEDGREAFTFDGIVTLTLRAVKDNISTLVLQENVKEIISVVVTDDAGEKLPLNEDNGSKGFARIRDYHFLEIYLKEGTSLVKSKNYIVTIKYVGNINETPLSRGVFRGSYKDENGKLHWYAGSHLQPTNSRQAFPCFDEPGFKSTFNIIINRPAHFTETFSNMKIKNNNTKVGDRIREVFYTTPRMSAYLVTFHISEQFEVIAENNNPIAPYRILARPTAKGQGAYALEVGPPLTKWLGNYFGIDYYTMGDTMAEVMKNDQIASPDWASGATENWGLVSYRELRLLYEEGETNALDKMNIGTITAHELAHKWFGNLITCRWWDNVWINEGFASYFEYFAMDGIDSSTELSSQFNILALQGALSTDSSSSTRALEHTVNSPAQVTGHFSGISYTKGASFLLMLKHFVGEETFKKALNYFLLDRAYEHAYPSHLFSSFAKAVQEDNAINSFLNIAEIMRYWVEQPGYPLIDVNVNTNTGVMIVTQERFFISASSNKTEQVWPLPLTYTTGRNPNWDNLTPTVVMINRSIEILKEPGDEWVIFNVQQKGFYRVNYDPRTWEMIADALKSSSSSSTNTTTIHRLNRAQIVDDVFALMRSERISFELGFKILDFLKDEIDYYSWYPAITGFSWIRNRFLHLPETLKDFDEILFGFLKTVIADLGYNVKEGEPLTTTLNRFFLLNFACSIGHEGCISDSINKYRALMTSGTSVNPNLRRHVFCQGVLNGGFNEWQFLNQRRLNSNNQADQVAMLRSLGCTTNDQAVEAYLQMILSDDLKAQDSVNAFTFLYIGSRSNTNAALQFIKSRLEEVRRKVVLPAWFESVLNNLASYAPEEVLRDMEQWLQSDESIPGRQVGLNAIGSARTSMQWGTDRAKPILKAARGSAIVNTQASMLLLIITSFALIFR